MPVQAHVQADEAELRDVADSIPSASTGHNSLEGDERVDGADEGLSPRTTAHGSPGEGERAPSSFSLPARGLPNELIAHIFAVSRLARGDYARCARVSRAFRRLAELELPYTAELGIMKSWDNVNGGPIWAYLEPHALAAWRRLKQPAIAAGTEELRIGLAQGGDVRFHPSSDERIARDELEEVTGEMIIDKVDLEALVASMPKLHTFDIHWYDGAFKGDDAVSIGRLEAVRSLSLSRWQPGLIIAAPGLVYLGVALDGGPVGLPVEACPPVKKVYITAFGYGYPHGASSATLRARLEWVTPPSLVLLALEAQPSRNDSLCTFLVENLPRWPDLREILLGDNASSRSAWQGSTEWDALKAMCDERGISINL